LNVICANHADTAEQKECWDADKRARSARVRAHSTAGAYCSVLRHETRRPDPARHRRGAPCCRKDAVRFATCVRHTRRALDGLRAGAAWFDMLLYILRTAAGELGASPLHRPALTTPSHCILPTAHATQRDRVGRAVVAGQGDCGTQPYPEPIQPIQPERPQLSCSASQRLHTLCLSSGTSTRPHAHCEPQRDARGTPAGLRS